MKRVLLLAPSLLLWGCDPPESGVTGNAIDSARSRNPAATEPAVRPGRPADPARDEAELVRLERDYARALVEKDRAFLMRFYAPDWRGGNWMGFWSKSTLLKSVLNERYVVRSMEVRDLKVRIQGGIAIVQGVDEEISAVDGKDTSGKWAFTDVFERRGGAWIAVASHTSEVKPAGN